jgi:hypothetical protein
MQWQFAHTFHKPPPCAYQTTLLVQPDMEIPQKEQLSRLLTFGGFNKGQLYGNVVAVEEWSVLKRGTKGAQVSRLGALAPLA